ncbi:MAG TPA: SRPBCC domain-containing protein [Verrucomicrobiae bacterium]|nr:SRPBCC domain-containing protein [Verrucomicrobiae bacterium]
MTREIKHRVTIRATPAKVYAALMDEKKHAQFTDARARIERRVGGTFTCYGTYINGITLELQPGKRIVQAWRSRNWPKGIYTIVTFKLSKAAGGRTTLRFSQMGVPASDYREKNKGWRTHYWVPLKRYLEDRKH